MPHRSLAGLDKRRLKLWLALFFLALAIPTGVLIRHAYGQLKWEAFHRYRVLAEEVATRIDTRLAEAMHVEEARSFADYSFLVVAGDPAANFLQRSPLSAYPVQSAVPGLIGYFQVDSSGVLSTPLLPASGGDAGAYGIAPAERSERLALQEHIRGILTRNKLVQASPAKVARPAPRPKTVGEEGRVAGLAAGIAPSAPSRHADESDALAYREAEAPRPVLAEEVPAQAAFDRLSKKAPAAAVQSEQKAQAANALGRLEDLKLEAPYGSAAAEPADRQLRAAKQGALDKRSMRRERSAVPQAQIAAALGGKLKDDAPAAPRVTAFESEIDPFELSLLDSGHLVLFRKVWRDGQRYIQGALIDQRRFLDEAIGRAFRDSALARMSDLAVAFRGDLLSAMAGGREDRYLASAEELRGALLYQTRLAAPLSDLELVFSVNRLPAGPGAAVIGWLAAILSIVLIGGFYLLYRLAAGQIELTRQQQDFVSAVSHELKTPLTSIRMYGEMLREGWAGEDKRRAYYEYICDESERLTRLINNVLQLARMTRNELRVDLRPVRLSVLLDDARSKLGSQCERAGFRLNIECDGAAPEAVLRVDADLLSQILINLVDNAIKFAAKAENRSVDVRARRLQDDQVVISVRDYGPGVPRDQMKKIFQLFYRPRSELTRETVGTGIGLALVRQLALSMNARVEVANREPGAELSVLFPIQS